MSRQITEGEWSALNERIAELERRVAVLDDPLPRRLGPPQVALTPDPVMMKRIEDQVEVARKKSSITDDPTDPRIKRGQADEVAVEQNEVYLVLSEEERGKGWVRPYRDAYVHVGEKPQGPLRDLTAEEHERYDKFGYVKYEPYVRDEGSSVLGRFWTQKMLDAKGCGTRTTMGRALSETYARDPHFYGATYCCGCKMHRPVAEFVWDGTDERVGS